MPERLWTAARLAALVTLHLRTAQAGGGSGSNGAYQHMLCGDRSACKVTAVTKVDRDPSGAEQAVATLIVRPADPAIEDEGCAQAEYWLVAGTAAKPLRHQLLASGYLGSCGSIGNDAQIAASVFDFEEFCAGGHADHFNHHDTLSLSPLGYQSDHGDDAMRVPATNIVGYQWDWSQFSGTGSTRYFRCDKDGDALSEDEPAGPLVHWTTIPVVSTATVGLAHLGGCAAAVDGTHAGFTIYGKPSSAADASFRAVLVGNDLFVEVTDDHWVGPGKDWTYDDHLEIWLAPQWSPAQLDRCEDLRAPGALQWGVRIVDGAVFAGYGKSRDKLGVRRIRGAAKDGDSALLAITLPAWFDPTASAISVVYSDSDDGKTQKRLIATSEVQMGKRWTLGRARVIVDQQASCSVHDGKLEPAVNHIFKSDEGLLGVPP